MSRARFTVCIGGVAVVMGVSDWDLLGLSPVDAVLEGGRRFGFAAFSDGFYESKFTWLHTSAKS